MNASSVHNFERATAQSYIECELFKVDLGGGRLLSIRYTHRFDGHVDRLHVAAAYSCIDLKW